jgi:hypothetical protein
MLAGICKKQPLLRQAEGANDFKDIKNNPDIIGVFTNGGVVGNLTRGKGLNFQKERIFKVRITLDFLKGTVNF